jgi:hypothetical protein
MGTKPKHDNIEDYWEVKDMGYKTPCHIWRYAKDEFGYGRHWYNGTNTLAHRFIYQKVHKIKLQTGTPLDHLCKIPACCNEAHLEIVTPAINCQRGKNAKINSKIAVEMRKMSILGIMGKDIAAYYGVHVATVSDVLRGVSWK